MAQHVQPGVQGIRTRGQYQRLLKRHGLTDDVTTKELMACATDRAKRERVREAGIRRVTDRVGERMRASMERPSTQTPLRQRLERYLSR